MVGDVSGKGVPAALLVSTLHSALRLLVEREGVTPALFERLNRHILASSSANKFITLLFAELDAADRHAPLRQRRTQPRAPLARRRSRRPARRRAGCRSACSPARPFAPKQLRLESGDLLCLYSDGITEAASPDDEEFGLDRLAALLAEGRQESLQHLVARIDRAVVQFAAGRPQGDDQTIVLLRRL